MPPIPIDAGALVRSLYSVLPELIVIATALAVLLVRENRRLSAREETPKAA